MAKVPKKSGNCSKAGNSGRGSIAELEERLRQAEQERDAAIERLRPMEETRWMLDALMDNIPEGIAIADASERRIRMVSRYGQQMLAKSAEELVGLELAGHGKNLGIFRPDGATVKDEELLLIRALEGEVIRNEEWLICPSDGREIPVLCNAGPVRDREGRIIGAVIAWRDIEQLKLAKRTMRSISEYRLALDSARLGTWDFDLMLRRFFLGERCRDLLATAESEVPYESFLELFHPEDRPRLDQAIKDAIAHDDDGFFSAELRVARSDQTFRWLLTHALAVFVGTGESLRPVRLIGTVMDITERKKSEQALREREERFRGTFENAAVGIAHVAFDGHFLRANQRFCDMLGYTPTELLERTFSELTSEEDLAKDLVQFERLRRGEIDHYSMEKRYQHHSGRTFWINMTRSLQKNEQNKPLYFITIIEDITRRKEAESECKVSEERLRLALNAVQGGIWEMHLDPDDPKFPDQIYISPQLKKAIGFTTEFPDSVAAWHKRIHPDDRRRVEQTARHYYLGETPFYQVEYRIRHRDGSWRWLLSLGRLLRDAQGRPIRWSGVDLNISDRKTMEQNLLGAMKELRAANRAKDEFVAIISHELRTPLTIILTSLHLLHRNDVPHRDYLLDESERAAEQLMAIIDDLLDFSLMEREELEISRTRFDLRDCVKKAADAVAGRAREKALQLHVEIAPEAPRSVLGDPARLEQILFNLMDNAVKFTETGGVDVRIGLEEESLAFSIRDTGIGIPEEKLHMVFDQFSQEDASNTRKYGGTGLGLAISKGLVELMGGKIRVKSRKGMGSEFSFTLPLINHQEPIRNGQGENGGQIKF